MEKITHDMMINTNWGKSWLILKSDPLTRVKLVSILWAADYHYHIYHIMGIAGSQQSVGGMGRFTLDDINNLFTLET